MKKMKRMPGVGEEYQSNLLSFLRTEYQFLFVLYLKIRRLKNNKIKKIRVNYNNKSQGSMSHFFCNFFFLKPVHTTKCSSIKRGTRTTASTRMSVRFQSAANSSAAENLQMQKIVSGIIIRWSFQSKVLAFLKIN